MLGIRRAKLVMHGTNEGKWKILEKSAKEVKNFGIIGRTWGIKRKLWHKRRKRFKVFQKRLKRI